MFRLATQVPQKNPVRAPGATEADPPDHARRPPAVMTVPSDTDEVAFLRGERARLEEALHRSDASYRQLFETAPVGIWLEDYSPAKRLVDDLKASGVNDFQEHFRKHPDRLRDVVLRIGVIDVNEAAYRLYRLESKDHYLAFDADYERWADGGWREIYIDQISALAEGATNYQGELHDRAADGTPFVGKVSSHILTGHEDDWSRVITSILDVTALATTRTALLEAKEKADLANRTKSEFLANMSHELRTPLNAIIGFSEMIQNGVFGPVGAPKYLEYVGDIRSSGEHLLGLINDILDISKIEAGKLVLDESEVDVERVVHSCVSLIRERAASRDIHIALKMPRIVPVLRADERKIKQCLINLLSNSAKFTLSGGWIDVSVLISDDGGIALDVADTGIGMTPDEITTAFTPFGQVRSDLSRTFDGTGLGLPLTKELMALHGGKIEMASEPGEGTTVTLRFPPERTVVRGSADRS